MKKLCLLTGLTLLSLNAFADECCYEDCGKFYIKLETGATFPLQMNVFAPSSEWDPSPQGYDARLQTRPFVEGGIGYTYSFFATDFTLAYRPNFKYRKFQTSSTTGTPGFLGNKKREFDLDISTLMWNIYLSGYDINALNWNFGCSSYTLYPVIGGGIGVNQLKIFNFRSTGLPSAFPFVDPSPSFGSENQYHIQYHFTYQVQIGLELNYADRWAWGMGYRWFDAGTVDGPRFIRDQFGIASDVQSAVWKIKFRANELYLNFKIFF